MTRACLPTAEGYVEVDGVEIGYELYDEGGHDQTILLMPTSCIVHARAWKLQIPYLARHYRVLTFDGPGNGRASRPADPAAFTAAAHVAYARAVLAATASGPVHVICVSGGTYRSLLLASEHPALVQSLVVMGPYVAFGEPPTADLATPDFDEFARRFMSAAFPEPHSTKAIEDGIEWAHGTTDEQFMTALAADQPADLDGYRAMIRRISCPVLVVQGTADALTPEANGRRLAEVIGDNARLVLVDGGGHRPDLRDPVFFSRLVREFIPTRTRTPSPPRTWSRGTSRRPRALFLSSPIGLGHARRDLAIAEELRTVRPDLEVDWLAQDPVTRVLEHAGERIHPASRYLASEAAHIESESAGHDLHCFQAWRRMDEILVANFMVLHDMLEEEHYDVVVADEAWEVDHFLHENPELKRFAFAWLTDFVGWLPVEGGGDDEPALTSDYNAELVEHVERFPWVRDRSIFVGNPDDIVPHDFGPGLPVIRDWVSRHYEFSGYVTGFTPDPGDRAQLRAELGFGTDELVCIATVGGSSVGTALLDRVVSAFPLAKAKLPELRMLVVTGPRIDPASLPADVDGLQATGFVPGLHRYLAACDLAVVQGGLTTAMELTAQRRPFLSFPLRRHFEQQIHVPHRLERYGAGRRMEYDVTDGEQLAGAIVEEIGRPVDYRPVETDGARRAAGLIAEML